MIVLHFSEKSPTKSSPTKSSPTKSATVSSDDGGNDDDELMSDFDFQALELSLTEISASAQDDDKGKICESTFYMNISRESGLLWRVFSVRL